MQKVKITVLKRMLNNDLIEKYRGGPGEFCSVFNEGQEFIIDSLEKPANFCDWAWNDIHKVVLMLLFDGNFGHFNPDDKNAVTACCTDGNRPVVFRIEKLV